MPSAQVLDFGPDPYAENIGKIAQGFSQGFFQQEKQRKNEEIFRRIKSKYGPDASPDRIFRDILEAEGLDQDYKSNLLSQVKDYITASSKGNINPYQKEMLDIRKEDLDIKKRKEQRDIEGEPTKYQQILADQRRADLALKERRVNEAINKNAADFPKTVSDYVNSLLKDEVFIPSAADKGILNDRIQSNIKEEKMSLPQAFNEAYDYIQQKNEIVDTYKIEKRPESWDRLRSPNPNEVAKSMEKAYQQLNELYESGIESQTDLRKIANRAGWESQEITAMLQKLFQSNGRKLRVPAAEKPAQAANLDDIMWGE